MQNDTVLKINTLNMDNAQITTCSVLDLSYASKQYWFNYAHAHALVISRLDYGNSLLYGLPDLLLDKLQRAQNAAARVVV